MSENHTWAELARIKKERQDLLPKANELNNPAYQKVRELENLISQITIFLVNNKVQE